jgi:hypothetical protein
MMRQSLRLGNLSALAMLTVALFALPVLAGPAEEIDDLFEQAAKAEKDGDCATANDLYTRVSGLSAQLAGEQKAQVNSQVAARLVRTKKCLEDCTITPRDQKLFDSAKAAQAKNETKRVGELCKQMLHGRNTKCKAYNEIRNFCPQLGEEGDPCLSVPEEVKTEVEALEAKLEALKARLGKAVGQAKGGSTKGLDSAVGVLRDMETQYERLFELREIYLQCDSVHTGLVEKTKGLREGRGQVQGAIASGYKSRIGKLLADVESLKASNTDTRQKLDALNAFTNQVFMDMLTLAEGESLTQKVNVEGQTQQQPGEAPADQLAKVMAGDREAIEAMTKSNPDFFATAAGKVGLKKKKESLERIDQLLNKFAEQGFNQGLGYQKAHGEVKGTLAVVNAMLGSEDVTAEDEATAAAGPNTKVIYGAAILLALIILGAAAMIVLRARKK